VKCFFNALVYNESKSGGGNAMKICVFGASAPVDKIYIDKVQELGKALGTAGHTLVFGGFNNGLMKAIADGFQEAGAKIIGVAPEFLAANLASKASKVAISSSTM
jgi:predicted Rossmann-fold nucleotide-binding protein